MGTALAPRRNDIRRHRTRDALGAVTVGLTSSDQHHALAIHSGASRRDFSHRVNFSRGRADRGRRARTSPDDSRVGGSMGHASPHEQRSAHSDLLVPSESIGPYQSSRWIARPGCSRFERQQRSAICARVSHILAAGFLARSTRARSRRECQCHAIGARHPRRQKRAMTMPSRILAVSVLLCSAVVSCAGGPAFVAGSGYNPGVEGQALIWANGSVQYFTDQGDFEPDPDRRSGRCFGRLRL